MMVTWVTQCKAKESIVEYTSRDNVNVISRALGNATKWKACGWKKRYLYIHRVKLKGLTGGMRYGKEGLSTVYS